MPTAGEATATGWQQRGNQGRTSIHTGTSEGHPNTDLQNKSQSLERVIRLRGPRRREETNGMRIDGWTERKVKTSELS